MNAPISYAVSRNVPATDNSGMPCKIALVLILFPDGSGTKLAIPEGLLATIPPNALDDFIDSEVAAAIGYKATRQ